MALKALVVGAGVCGPVTAMALERVGIDAVVYDAHGPTAADAGSYLTVATNGLDALRAIDAHGPVLKAGFPTSRTTLFSGTGKQLQGTVPIGSTRGERDVSYTLKRAHLHRALHEEAARRGVPIEFSKRLVGAEVTPSGVRARSTDTHALGDLLVGCDGVHSVTRTIIDPDAPPPRYVGLLNFGGYTPGTAVGEAGAWHMIFGVRAFFGYVPDAAGRNRMVCQRSSPAVEPNRTRVDDGRTMEATADRALRKRSGSGDGADWRRQSSTHRRQHARSALSARVAQGAAHHHRRCGACAISLVRTRRIDGARWRRPCQCAISPDRPEAFTLFEHLRRHRVERIVAQGARSSNSKAASRRSVLRDLALPLVFRYLVTEKSLAWMYDYHIDWNSPVASG